MRAIPPTRLVSFLYRALAACLLVAASLAFSPSEGRAQAICDEWGNCDVNSPWVSVSPLTGTHVTTATLSVSASSCDDTDVSYLRLYVNGSYVAGGYGNGSGCVDVEASVTLNAGANSVSASACDIYDNCASRAATIYYDAPAPPTYGVSVSPASGSLGTFAPGATGTASFTISNTSSTTSTINYTWSCGGGSASCAGGSSSTTLAKGGSAPVNVGFTTSAVGTGTVYLSAVNSEAGGGSASGQQSFTVAAPVTVSVSSSGGTSVNPGGYGSVQFSVTNTSSSGVASDFTASPSCPGGWSCAASPTAFSLAPGGATTVSVSFTAGSTPGSYDVGLAVGGAASGSSSAPVTVLSPYGVSVSALPATTAYVGATAYQQFRVTNSGSVTETINFSCTVTNSSTGCAVQPSIPLDPGTSVSISVSFTGAAAGTSAVTLSASVPAGPTSASATQYVNVQSQPAVVAPIFGPDGDLAPAYAGSRASYLYPITNPGSTQATYDFTVADCGGGRVVNCTVTPDTMTLGGGAGSSVTVSFDIPAGTAGGLGGRVSVQALVKNGGGVGDVGYGTVNVISQQAPASVRIVEKPASGPLKLAVGQSRTLSGQVLDASGAVMSGQTLSWSSDNAAIVRVSGSTITGVATGSTVIRATSVSNPLLSDAVTVDVYVPRPSRIAIAPVTGLKVGTTQTATATVYDSLGNAMPSESVTFSSADLGILAVQSQQGLSATLLGVSAATTTLIAVSNNPATPWVRQEISVQVDPPPPPASTPTQLRLAASTSILERSVGTATLTATVLDQYGVPMSGQTVNWVTRNTSIVTLPQSSGQSVTAQASSAIGYVYVVANVGAVTDSVRLRVLPKRGAPLLTFAPEQPNLSFADPSRCAVDCFQQVTAYTTPSYVTMDTPRALTIMHRSGYRNGWAKLLLDVDPQSAQQPNYLSIVVKRQDGVILSLGYKSQIYFAVDTGLTRMAVQVNTTGLPDGPALLEATVTAGWSDSTATQRFSFPVLVTNPPNSAWKDRWFVAGMPEMQPVNGGYIVYDGWGGVSYFSGTCSTPGCSYAGPAEDPSTLTRTESELVRRFPDGSTHRTSLSVNQRKVCDRFNLCTTYALNGYGLGSITDPAGAQTFINYEWNESLGDMVPSYIALPSATGSAGSRGVALLWDWGSLTIQDPIGTYGYSLNPSGVYAASAPGRGFANYDYIGNGGELAGVRGQAVAVDGGMYASPTLRMLPASGRILEKAWNSGQSTAALVPASLDRRAVVVGPRGDTTYLDLNKWGSSTRTTDARGQVTTSQYDPTSGRPTRVVGTRSDTTVYFWSGAKLDSTYASATRQWTRITYDPTFLQPLSISSGGVTQTFTYDTGRPTRPILTSSFAGKTTTYAVNDSGRILWVKDPEGHLTSWYYQLARPFNTDSLRAPGPRREKFAYDSYGRVTRHEVVGVAIDSLSYDDANRVIAAVQVNPLTGELRTTRSNIQGNQLRSLIDAKGQSYTFGRNPINWMTSQSDVRFATEEYTYDVGGALRSTRTRMYDVIRTGYDAFGRPLADSVGGVEVRRFAYDPQDRWVVVRNAESIDTVFTNALGALDSVVTIRGGHRVVVQYDYRDPRFPTTRTGTVLRLDSNRAAEWTRTLNGAGLTETFTGGNAPGVAQFSYNNDLKGTGIRYGNGTGVTREVLGAHTAGLLSFTPRVINDRLRERYAYDSTMRIRERRYVSSDTVTRMTYDYFGQLTEERKLRVQAPTCHFDMETGERCVGTETILASNPYTYDPVGNPTNGGAVIQQNLLSRLGDFAFEYDNAGRLKRKYRWADSTQLNQRFDWNAFDQLVRVTTLRNGVGVIEGTTAGTTIVDFRYDGFGRRIRKSVAAAGQPAKVTEYLWDGDEVMGELDGSSWGFKREIVSLGPDQPMLIRAAADMYLNDTTFYVWNDAQGNVRGVTMGRDTLSTAFVAAAEYSAWGNMLPARGLAGLPSPAVRFGRGFKGAAYDPETGLSYMRARFYDADARRFISEDPIGLAGGDNPFRFGGNDPVNLMDPFGLCPVSEMEIVVNTETGEWSASCPDGTSSSGRLGVVRLAPVVSTASASGNPFDHTPLSDRGANISALAISMAAQMHANGIKYDLPPGFGESDCSHFVCDVMHAAGVNVPYLTSHQITRSKCYQQVPASEASAGDVMYSPQGHVGIYSGRVDDRGRWIGTDWSRRMNGSSPRMASKWGPGGWYALPISFYRAVC